MEVENLIYITSVKVQIFETPNLLFGRKDNKILEAQSWVFMQTEEHRPAYDLMRYALDWAFKRLDFYGFPETNMWVKIVVPGNYRSFQYKNTHEVARLDTFTAPSIKVKR